MKAKISMIISIALLFISSFSISFIPLSDFDGNTIQKMSAYFIGILFWLFLLCGWIIQIVIFKSVKKIDKRLGIISFFENTYAKIFDILMAISLVVVISITIISTKSPLPDIVSYLSISVFLFAFQMHCIFNGKNFEYITKQ